MANQDPFAVQPCTSNRIVPAVLGPVAAMMRCLHALCTATAPASVLTDNRKTAKIMLAAWQGGM